MKIKLIEKKIKMNKQTNQRLQSLLLATMATIFLLGAFGSAFAQAGSGAKYGSRDVSTCDDMKAPAKGAITAELAAKYARCTYEKADSQGILLLEDLKVQVGGSVPFNARTYPYMTDITPGAPVYQLRGSYKNYICSQVSDDARWGNRGKNCTMFVNTKAEGVCYRTTFGDWYCAITGGGGANDANLSRDNMPPPGEAKAAVVEDKPTKDNAKPTAKVNAKPAAAKEVADDGKDGYPKPDFSEIEKWYEVVKSEYGDIAGGDSKLYFSLKPKNDNRPNFYVEFYDKDGALVEFGSMSASCWTCSSLDPVGRVQKYEASTPPGEERMKKVASVKILRFKN